MKFTTKNIALMAAAILIIACLYSLVVEELIPYWNSGQMHKFWTTAIWVIKLLPNGDIQWQKTLGWLFSDYAYEIQSTSDGGFIVCGSYFHGAGDPKFNQGSNFWMVKYPEESLSTSEFENSNIKIYPNPTTSLLTIDTLHSIDTIQITNMLGQTVLYQNNVLNKTLDVSSLQTGMYFLNLTLNNQLQVIRFVKN